MMWFMRFPEGKAKAFTLSYDDGVRSDLRLVEILNKYNIKCTFNINSGLFGTGRRMTLEEAKQCYSEGGHEVALHSYTHPALDNIPHDLLVYEIMKDRETLEKEFGVIVQGMAYPGGRTNDKVVNALKSCGISYSRTTVQTGKFNIPTDWLRMPTTCHHNHSKLMEFAKDFIEGRITKLPELFYVWGHSYEFDDDNNWDVIENFCEYMSGKENIWYATNIQIYDYIEAYSRMRCSLDGKFAHNPTATTLWFENKDGKLFKIAPGETIEV